MNALRRQFVRQDRCLMALMYLLYSFQHVHCRADQLKLQKELKDGTEDGKGPKKGKMNYVMKKSSRNGKTVPCQL